LHTPARSVHSDPQKLQGALVLHDNPTQSTKKALLEQVPTWQTLLL
jgi:hypothetical protein